MKQVSVCSTTVTTSTGTFDVRYPPLDQRSSGGGGCTLLVLVLALVCTLLVLVLALGCTLLVLVLALVCTLLVLVLALVSGVVAVDTTGTAYAVLVRYCSATLLSD